MPRSRARRGLLLAVAITAFSSGSASADLVGSPDLSATPTTSGPCGQTPSCLVIQTTAPDGVALTSNRTSSTLARIDLKKGAQPLTIKPAVARKNANGSFTIVSIGSEITFPATAGEHSAAIDPPLTIAYGEYPAIFYPQGSFANENADLATEEPESGYGITYFSNVTGPGDYSRNFMLGADPVAQPSTALAGYHFRMRFFIPSEKDGQEIPTGPPTPPDDGDEDPPDQGDGGGGDLEPAVCPRNPSKPSPRPCADLQLTAVSPQDFGERVDLEDRRKDGDLPRRFRNAFIFAFEATNAGPDPAVETVITGEALKAPNRSGIQTLRAYPGGVGPCDGGALSELVFGFTCDVRTLAVNQSGAGGAILYLAQAGTVSYSASTSSKTSDPGPEPNSATLTATIEELVTSKGREVRPRKNKPLVFDGDAKGANKVEVAVAKPQGGAKVGPAVTAGCRWLTNKRAKFETESGKSCDEPVWLEATGTKTWKFKMKKPLPRGKYVLFTRASGDAGQVEINQDARYGNRIEFRVR